MRVHLLSTFLLVTVSLLHAEMSQWYLPVRTADRQSLENVTLTHIGPFGLLRKARPNIPAHHHTGSDFKRPSGNYTDEPIFPAAAGTVVSVRDDGPYAQIIIGHTIDSTHLWTVYEHIAGIKVRPGHTVSPETPIARFMTRAELDKYGWQFDHVHFEVMKVTPRKRTPDAARPYMRAGTYALTCYTKTSLDKHYYDPLNFFEMKWQPLNLGYGTADSLHTSE